MLKRALSFFFVLIILVSVCATVYAGNGDTIVYVTRTGEKYHVDGCSYLKSQIAIELEDAVDQGYTRCSRCHPPSLEVSSNSGDSSLYQGYSSGNSSTYTQSAFSTPKPTRMPSLTPAPSRPTPKPTVKPSEPVSTGTVGTSPALLVGFSAIFVLSLVKISKISAALDGERAAHASKCRELEVERTAHALEKRALETERAAHKALSLKFSDVQSKYSQCAGELKSTTSRLNSANQRISDLEETNQQLQDELTYLKNTFFSDESISLPYTPPPGVFIGEDGLPADHGDRKWGRYYTFYYSENGACYHDNYLCSGARIPINASKLGGLRPCGKCKPVLPDLTWYYNAEKIREKIKARR